MTSYDYHPQHPKEVGPPPRAMPDQNQTQRVSPTARIDDWKASKYPTPGVKW